MRENFLLSPGIIFLNHGSFGATPKPVFESYQRWQLELERQPVDFIGRRSRQLLLEARKVLGGYLHTSETNLVYMTNVTAAMNAVARSLQLREGDEVLATNQEYGSMDRTWKYLSSKQGFTYINTPIELPVTTAQKYIDDLWKGVSSRTRVLFFSHISSPTSIIAPVKEICQRAKQEGILTVIDGAHAPGQLDLDLQDIGADFYGANLHKWLCAPKGSGFLYASPQAQPLLEPLIVTFGGETGLPGSSRLVDLYEYQGTRDLAAFLAVPEAIAFQRQNNWEEIRCHAHALARNCMVELGKMTGLQPLYSPDSTWYAQMATIPILSDLDLPQLRKLLLEEHQIEVPVMNWNQRSFVRVSIQAYNTAQELDTFLIALKVLMHR